MSGSGWRRSSRACSRQASGASGGRGRSGDGGRQGAVAAEQQGLQGRSLAGATIGNRVINNRRFRLTLDAGLVVNSEDFDTTQREESLEGVLSSTARWRSARDIDVDASLAVLPSLEQRNRVRSQFDITISVGLWGDLDFKLTVYDRYDSQPPEGNDTNDTGLTLGLSWSY